MPPEPTPTSPRSPALLGRWLGALPWHSLCAVCHQAGRELICLTCVARFAPLSAPLRVAARAPLDALFVALPDAFPWDGLIGQLKFHERLDLNRPLAQRLRARGYNQSALLAHAALRHLGWPRGLLSLDGLVRTRDTPPQRDLSAAERVRNVRDAFAVPTGQAHQVAGQHVAVVDDVTTSGATLAEAARVSGWALARTPLPGEG